MSLALAMDRRYKFPDRGCSPICRCHPHLSEVVADGCISDASQDPPIQHSVYILPGDVRKECYRVSTFEQYPVTCQIKRRKFASSGFYFTGFTDRVECFACGRKVENWEDGDDPTDNKWHKQECAFRLGQECGNIPLPSLQLSSGRSMASQSIYNENSNNQRKHVTKQQNKRCDRSLDNSAKRMKIAGGTSQRPEDMPLVLPSEDPPALPNGGRSQLELELWIANVNSNKAIYLNNLYYNRELDRLASFANWPVQRPSVTPADLAKDGFFYLGDSDRTQCFSCGVVLNSWSPDDDVAEKHARLSSECKMTSGSETHNVPVGHLPETLQEKDRNYPCRFAGNPNMKAVRSRLDTFDHRWPMNRTNVTPEQLAEAGFFYLGEQDKVKCWYCDGILPDWERLYDPWEDHAKWFPTCQFLLQSKGVQFVYLHLADNAHLPRRTVWCQGHPSSMPPERSAEAGTLPTTIISPQEEARLRQERVCFALENSENVKVILEMGFPKEIVETQLENYLRSSNQDISDDIYDSAAQLVDDLLQNEQELKIQVEEKNLTEEDLISSAKEEGWREAVQKLADERLCKVCFVYPHNAVFIPCGHICCCLLCALCLNTCPVCRARIDRFHQTYEA